MQRLLYAFIIIVLNSENKFMVRNTITHILFLENSFKMVLLMSFTITLEHNSNTVTYCILCCIAR